MRFRYLDHFISKITSHSMKALGSSMKSWRHKFRRSKLQSLLPHNIDCGKIGSATGIFKMFLMYFYLFIFLSKFLMSFFKKE